MKRHYGFGGLELTLSMPRERYFDNERRLQPFAIPEVTAPHTFVVSFVDQLEPPEGAMLTAAPGLVVFSSEDRQIRYLQGENAHWQHAVLRVEHDGYSHRVQVKKEVYPGKLNVRAALACFSPEYLVVRNHAVILHASFIQIDDGGILFTAVSGTGKSTQAELWRKYRNARICNGDRAIMHLQEDMVLAQGLPFAGSSTCCENVSIPLKAIVCLSQAPATTIRLLQGFEAYRQVWEGCVVNTWNREDVLLASETVQEILQRVPVYHLACTPDISAVDALDTVLRKQENP